MYSKKDVIDAAKIMIEYCKDKQKDGLCTGCPLVNDCGESPYTWWFIYKEENE